MGPDGGLNFGGLSPVSPPVNDHTMALPVMNFIPDPTRQSPKFAASPDPRAS
jgi:hypothetical protein